MGLLDDAIREHLDLKRRRGADPAEVERAEREALGPVRRGPEPAETPDTEFENEDDAAAYDLADDPDWGDVEAEEPVPPASEPPLEEEVDRPAPAPPRHLGDETAEYNVEEALGHEPDSEHEHEHEHEHERDPEPASDDMLEETPEFLQDTPDHDRLWFEQKPPRDFKFDS